MPPTLFLQSELTAAEAAGLWAQVREQADKYDMQLVSPAINFCYGECIEEVSAFQLALRAHLSVH